MSKESYKFSSKIDATGRFVIPKPMLRELNWNDVSKVNVEVDSDNNRVIITPASRVELKCNKCNKEVRYDYKYCPYCGEKLNG